MNTFDAAVITYVNQFSQHSQTVDKALTFLFDNHLLKGGVLATIIWWAWFRSDEHQSHNRKHIISTLISCVVAIIVARGLALTLPFRLRPLHQEGLNFLPPYGVKLTTLGGWSSFPSDHAVLFTTLSIGLLFVSRKVGTFAVLYTALFICFPRIYLGYHYPTDIIAGAIIGMTVALLSNVRLVNSKYVQLIENRSYSKPYMFYPLFFLFTYQIADMFASGRSIIRAGVQLFQIIFA